MELLVLIGFALVLKVGFFLLSLLFASSPPDHNEEDDDDYDDEVHTKFNAIDSVEKLSC